MAHVDDRIQPRAQDIRLTGVASFLGSHRLLRCNDAITNRDSTESSKIKLQAFASPKSETLQSQTPARPQNQLPLNGLKGSSRTTRWLPQHWQRLPDRSDIL